MEGKKARNRYVKIKAKDIKNKDGIKIKYIQLNLSRN